LNNEEYDFKADIWAIGVVFFELITQKHPFGNRNQLKLKQILLGKYNKSLL